MGSTDFAVLFSIYVWYGNMVMVMDHTGRSRECVTDWQVPDKGGSDGP